MQESIIRFIKSRMTASICCLGDDGYPYCFSCFYSFDVNGLLFFKSAPDSVHMRLLDRNPLLAGTILQDNIRLSHIKGIQFKGKVLPEYKGADTYHSQFPFAHAFKGQIVTVELISIKMTDNTIGIGRKILWEKEAIEQ